MTLSKEERDYQRRLFDLTIHKLELEVERAAMERDRAEVELQTTKLVHEKAAKDLAGVLRGLGVKR